MMRKFLRRITVSPIIVENRVALRLKGGAGDLDQTGIAGATLEGQSTQFGRVDVLSREPGSPHASHCRMAFERHDRAPHGSEE